MAGKGSGVTLGFLKFVLGLDGLAFEEGLGLAEKQLKASQKKLAKIGDKFTGAGKALSLSITAPFTALVASSIPAATESAQAMGQVEAALTSMGGASGRTKDQLAEAATELMHLSTFDDDEILRKVTANLLTFGNVAGTQFDRAQRAAVDLSTRMGGDLQAATIMVGKALNDPVKGMTALRKVGIQLNEQQQEQVKAFTAAGNAAGAQSVILGELERQFGGSAKAMRDATPGADLKNAWDDFQETIGAIALKVLPPFTAALTRVIERFNALSPETQRFAVAGAAVAAALGPAAIAIGAVVSGFSKALPLLNAFGVAARLPGLATLGAAGGPLLLIAAAAGAVYLAYRNWDKIGPYIDGVVEETTKARDQIAAKLKEIGLAADEADRRLGTEPQHNFTDSMIQAVVDAGGRWDAFAKKINELSDWVDQQALLPLAAAWNRFAKNVTTFSDQVDAAVSRAFNGAVATAQRLYVGVKTWLQDKLGVVFTWVEDKTKQVGDAFFKLYDRVVGHSYIPDMVDEIGQHVGRLTPLMVKPIADATAQASGSFLALQAGAVEPVQAIAEQSEAAWVSIARSASEGARNIIGAIQGGGLLDIMGSLLDAFTQLAGAGVFGKTIATNVKTNFGGFRAAGGPAVPGRSYVVGEHGPEWFTPRARGFVTPGGGEGRGGTVRIVPSPYFSVVVDGRAGNIVQRAAPAIAAGGSADARMREAARRDRMLA